MNKRVIAVIPARWKSVRFPGKPLAKILGKTLLSHTVDNSKNLPGIDHLLVATDDARIASHCGEIGVDCVMTSPNHQTGSDRILEALTLWEKTHAPPEIVVNIQGDEPCLPSEAIEGMLALLAEDPKAPMATAACPLPYHEKFENPSIVKCVVDSSQNALYFSRALIPGGKVKPKQILCHMGVYAFRRTFLKKYGELAPTPLQLSEDLEQLKVLEHGYKIKTALVDHESLGVDTPEDIHKVETYLCKKNTSSSPAGSSLP